MFVLERANAMETDDGMTPTARNRSNTWPRAVPICATPPLPVEQAAAEAATPAKAMEAIAENEVTPMKQVAVPAPPQRPRNAWGNASYADLIAQAITSSPEGRLTLSQIYRWLEQNVPYFATTAATNTAGWKNSVRHNLSLLDRFVRVQNEDRGQSSWWTVDPDAKPGRGSRTRRRASSMEATKMAEQRRGRALERARSFRRAKQRPDPADQLASSLGQYMALDVGLQYGPGARGYQPPAGCYGEAHYYDQNYQHRPMSCTPSPTDYHQLPTILDSMSTPYELPTVIPTGLDSTMSGYPCTRGYQPEPNTAQYQPVLNSNVTGYQPHPEPSPHHYQPIPDRNSPEYQPVFDRNPSQYQPIPGRNPASQYQPVFDGSPPIYQPRFHDNCSPYQPRLNSYSQYQPLSEPSPPLSQPAANPSPPLCQPAANPSPPVCLAGADPSPPPREPPNGAALSSQPSDLSLSVSIEGGLDCDVEAVVKQELILEGSLDFNFGQVAPQPPPPTQRFGHFGGLGRLFSRWGRGQLKV